MRNDAKRVVEAIRAHQCISLFFHEKPDPDAFGCAYGMREIIAENFPDKDVRICGLETVDINEIPKIFPIKRKEPRVPDSFIKRSLAIVMDTANRPRIHDQRYATAKSLIKIDHHPEVDKFGDISLVDDKVSSASEIVARMCITCKLRMNAKAATYLYTGMVTDTGNFRFQAVNSITHRVAANLLDTGMDKVSVYASVGSRDIASTRAAGFILSNYKVMDPGLAYLIVRSTPGLPFQPDDVKNLINTMSGIEGIEVWSICIWDKKTMKWRASFRSRSLEINKIVELSGGGGHRHAAGCVLSTLEEYQALLEDLQVGIRSHKRRNGVRKRQASAAE